MGRFVIAIGLLVVCIKSCETKSQELATPAKLLTSSPWKRVGPATCCESSYTFLADETLVNACGTITKWHISADGKLLSIVEAEKLGGAAFPYQVEKLTAHTLQLKRVSGNLIITAVYTH